MANIDRQIGISGGWIAGPSAGLAMMAAPEYLHLHPLATEICFWTGIIVFFLSVSHVFYVQGRGRNQRVSGPAFLIMFGIFVALIGVAWMFWPYESADLKESEAPNVSVLFDCFAGAPFKKTPSTGIAVYYILQNIENQRGVGMLSMGIIRLTYHAPTSR